MSISADLRSAGLERCAAAFRHTSSDLTQAKRNIQSVDALL